MHEFPRIFSLVENAYNYCNWTFTAEYLPFYSLVKYVKFYFTLGFSTLKQVRSFKFWY